MNIVLSTCRKYHNLLPGWITQFRRYYGTDTVHVITDYPLPSGIATAGLVIHCVPGQAWTGMVNTVITALPDPTLFLFDDYWLTQPVVRPMVDHLAGLVAGGTVDKGDLGLTTSIYAHTAFAGHPAMVISSPGAQYRSTLQPAIWSQEAMLRLTSNSNLNPWQAETQPGYWPGIRIAQWATHDRVMDYANMYLKGAPNMDQICQLTWDDMRYLISLGHADFIPALTVLQYCQCRASGSHVFKGT